MFDVKYREPHLLVLSILSFARAQDIHYYVYGVSVLKFRKLFVDLHVQSININQSIQITVPKLTTVYGCIYGC